MTISTRGPLPPVLDPELSPEAVRHGRVAAVYQARDAVLCQMAAGVAYEFEARTSACLTELTMAFEASVREGGDTRAIAAAQRQVESMAATVRGLKGFSTEEGRREEAVNVHEPLELALRLAGPTVRAKATIERRYAPTELVHGSAPRLARVFAELLRNAGEAIPRGTPDANHVTVQTGQDGAGNVTIVISDTGIGIEPADLPFLFDPFFTTKLDVPGRGLGLAVAASDVHALGGDLRIESLLGRGTRVTVSLPGAVGGRIPAGIPILTTREGPRSRILAVGSSHAAARQVAHVFAEGEVVVIAATWGEALERLALAEAFDLVVCDGRTPACEAFRAHLVELVPDTRARVFDVSLVAPDDSGVFPRPTTSEHEPLRSAEGGSSSIGAR
jgi:anti-sigma regulatory factor (Ser/Thr protein kinase)